MIVQDCSQLDTKTWQYYQCLYANAAVAQVFASGGGGGAYRELARNLVSQFVQEIGLDTEAPLPQGQVPNLANLVGIVNQLRDLGELNPTLQLSNIVTLRLAETAHENSLEILQNHLDVRAKLLNGLGRGDEAFHDLNLLTVVKRFAMPQVPSS
jgi:hypothetical protein